MKLQGIKISKDGTRKLATQADDIIHGRFITSRLFKRYFFGVLLAVALIMMSISVRYDCTTGMETIASLRTPGSGAHRAAARALGLHELHPRVGHAAARRLARPGSRHPATSSLQNLP